jgi:hypothetical protein
MQKYLTVPQEYSEEHPVLTVAQVPALAELMPYCKYHALILITASTHCDGVRSPRCAGAT